MSPDLTIALCLRDDETRVADMANTAIEVGELLTREFSAGEWAEQTREEAWPRGKGQRRGDLDWSFELLALDECSRDNTPSVLSILHAKHAQLRTLEQLEPGTAVMRAARSARGRAWLIIDSPFELRHGLWAARQVLCSDAAALVPGEVLAVRRNLGQAALGWHNGGLVGAQREVARMLAAHGQHPAWSPPRNHGLGDRARLFVRGQLGRVGFGHFDRS